MEPPFRVSIPATQQTSRCLIFRPYRVEDAGQLYEAARESAGPGFTDWMPWCHPDYSQEESLLYAQSRPAAWEKGEDYSLAVFDAESEEFLGGCGINQVSRLHGYANLGYWVRRSCWGQGIAVASVEASCLLAFEHLGLRRAEIVVAVGNHASRRAAEKAGALFEGVLRQRLCLHGRSCDAWMLSRISGESLDDGAKSGELSAGVEVR